MRPFEYAVLRIVPRVDRGETLNGAVLLYCQSARYLGIRLRDDLSVVKAVCPEADIDAIRGALRQAEAVAQGAPEAGSAGQEDPGPRFRWLTAPRSAVIQPGPTHTGLTSDPRHELERIAQQMLESPPQDADPL